MKNLNRVITAVFTVIIILLFIVIITGDKDNKQGVNNKYTTKETLSNYKKIITALNKEEQIQVNTKYVEIPVIRNDGGGEIIIDKNGHPNSKYKKITTKDGIVEHHFNVNTSVINLGSASYVKENKCWKETTNTNNAIYDAVAPPTTGHISQLRSGEIIFTTNLTNYYYKAIIIYDKTSYKLISINENITTPDTKQLIREDISYKVSKPYLSQKTTCK